MAQEHLISIFDYLGRAAGPELGKDVYYVARELKETIGERQVSNSKYKGKILLYRRQFLEEYFTKKQTINSPSQDDDLPF